MPIVPLPLASFGEAATPALFGGNILAPRTAMTGPGSYAEVIEALGVTTLRYPGGSLTESFFDISNPDARTATDNETGERVDFMPLSDLMDHAAETGRAVTIVIPTRDQLSASRFDDNGDRFAAVDADELTEFVRDVVTGVYGDAPVAGFEIGNEYWGSGRMNAVEYGRVAAEMTAVIDAELQALLPLYPEADQVDILVQQGTNFNFSSLDETYEGQSDAEVIADLNATYGLDLPPNGRVDWTEVNNLIVLAQFDDPSVLDAVDGVIAHVYSRGPEAEHTRYFHMDQIEDTWQEVDPDLEIHVTEWNLRSGASNLIPEEDYGLYQAQEMLEIVEAFMAEGVDAAQVWPLIQNTPSALSVGFDFSGSTAPGQMFALMSANLPGMTMLDFSPDDVRDGEYEPGGPEVHGFADGSDLLFYITAPQGAGVVQSGVDVSALVADVAGVEATVLGVAPGQAPGNTRSDPVLETLAADDVYADGVIDAVLAPGEILQLRLIDVTPTAEFAPVLASTAPEGDLIEALPFPELEPADPDSSSGVEPAGPAALDQPASSLAASPLAASPLAASPLAASPLAASPLAASPEEAAADLMMVMGFRETSDTAGYILPSAPFAGAEDSLDMFPTDPVPVISGARGSSAGEAAFSAGSLVSMNAPAASEGAEIMTLLSLPIGASGSAQFMEFPDLETQGDTADEGNDSGGAFDDMGLGWALALMPLLALAGLLG